MEKDESLAKLIGDEMANPNPAVPHAEQKHTRMRRAFAPALTKHALKLQSSMILGHVDELIDEICQKLSAPVDMVDMYAFCVYNIFTDLFLGESLDLFKSSKYHPWVGSFTSFAKGTTMMGALHHFPALRYILKAVLLTVGKSQRDAFLGVCFERFDRRLAANTDRPDLLHFAMGEKKQLSTQELRDFAPFLIIGGGETTPTLLSGLTYLLLKHEKKLARLSLEIRSSFTDDKQMTMENLFQMPYLSACIEEALRIYPPIAGAVERVVPKGGASVLGQKVPQGTLVTLCHHAMYHESRNFHSPDEFVPERWLAEASKEFVGDRKSALKPFSFGNQACIGQELAQLTSTPKSSQQSREANNSSQMSLIYNALSRGFNSIYLQAPHVQVADYTDFIGYSLAWTQVVKAHIEGAEEFAGPRIAKVTGKQDALDVPSDFKDALHELQHHLVSIAAGGQGCSFSGSHLVSLMDRLRAPLSGYLRGEIETLRSLSSFGDELDVLKLVSEDGDKAMGKLSLVKELPLLFLNNDATFEDGMHRDYPPVAKPLRWALLHVFTWRHWRWWKFATCDSYERPKRLHCDVGSG
ncbi:MAG: hypothetical protein Q9214_005810 [Letrouitia sp. 1 TL-2023]